MKATATSEKHYELNSHESIYKNMSKITDFNILFNQTEKKGLKSAITS